MATLWNPRLVIHSFILSPLPRIPSKILAIGVAASVFPAPPAAEAQAVTTVRESEFRSRWQNFQVDLPRDVPLREPLPDGETAPDAASPRRSLRSFFQNGPVVLRGSLALGWETSNEQRSAAAESSPKSSFFAAPTIALFYDREVGPWDVSLRYSGGYVHFFTPDYLGDGKSGIQSHTAGADVRFRGTRLELRSNAAASYGSGYDIQRGDQSDRLIFTELLAADYQIGEFMRAGASGSISHALYPSDAAGPEDSQTILTSSLYGDYFWTGRTRFRIELGAGTDTQNTGGASFERDYSQALFRVNYRASGKLGIDVGVGGGVVEDSNAQVTTSDSGGFRMIYTLAMDYAPTEKTSARLYFGLDGVSIRPEFALTVNWHPRQNTFAYLSIYQRTNLSTIVLAQDRTTRGVLASVRQRLFGRVDLSLGGGYELEEIAEGSSSSATGDDGYYFVAGGLSWQMNAWAAWHLDSRVGSNRYQTGTEDDGLQARTTLSLRLTF